MGLKKFFALTLVACALPGFLISGTALALEMPNFNNDGIEAQVNSLFSYAPVMITIAKCESGFRQYSNGMPLRGGNAGNYIGIFQISAGHASEATSLGFDIYTTDGNLGYAKYMYDHLGPGPWSSCTGRQLTETAPTPTTPVPSPTSSSPPPPLLPSPLVLSINLQFGMTNPQVLVLQKLLNSLGFTISQSGPGSPGNETTMFGQLTREAVKKFQCAKINICSGSESDTGYGRVGPKTRAALITP